MLKFSKNQGEKAFEDIIEKKMIPMLLEYKPFKELIKYARTPQMNTVMKSIEELQIEEKKQILEVNNLHKEKAKIAPTVLYLSNQLNSANKKVEIELEEAKNRLLEINNEIKEREKEIQELQVTKEKYNLELLKATLGCSYDIIKQDEKMLKPLLGEIENMRKELEKKRVLRDQLQGRINATYGFIHGFMGGKETEKIDEQVL